MKTNRRVIVIAFAAALVTLLATPAVGQDLPRVYVEQPTATFVDEEMEARIKAATITKRELSHRRHAKRLIVVEDREQADVVVTIVSADMEEVANTGKGFWGDVGRAVADDMATAQGRNPERQHNTVRKRVVRAVLETGDYQLELASGATTRPEPPIDMQVARWVEKNRAALQQKE